MILNTQSAKFQQNSKLPDSGDQVDELDEPEFEWDDTGVIPKATVQT